MFNRRPYTEFLTLPWRQIPKEFAPFTTVQGYFYRFCRDGTFDRINHVLVMQAREIAGRE